MKTLILRRIYEYLSFVRHELPNLFRVLGLGVEEFSSFDDSLKLLLSAIDDEILLRQFNLYLLESDDVNREDG